MREVGLPMKPDGNTTGAMSSQPATGKPEKAIG